MTKTIDLELLALVTGGADTLPNGEPNSLLIGGPAPVVPPVTSGNPSFDRLPQDMKDWVRRMGGPISAQCPR